MKSTQTSNSTDDLGGSADLLYRILSVAVYGMVASLVLQLLRWMLWLNVASSQGIEWLVLLIGSVIFFLALLYARRLVRQDRKAQATSLLFGGMCVSSALVAVAFPTALGLALMAATFSLFISLPYVSRRVFKHMSLIAIGLVVVLVPVSALLSVGRPAPTLMDAMSTAILMMVSAILLVILIWQMHDWLTKILQELRISRETLEAKVDARTHELQTLNQSLRQQTAYLELLHETALGIMNRQGHEQLFDAIISRACALFDTPHAFIALISEDGNAMVTHTARGCFMQWEHEIGEKPSVPRGAGAVGVVWATGNPLGIEDYVAWPGQLNPLAAGAVKSIMLAPLKRAGQVIGVIAIAGSPDQPAFGKDDLDCLHQLAQLASVAVDNTLLLEAAHSNEKMLEQVVAERTAELSALLGVSQNISATLELPALLETIFQQLDGLIEYDAGTIFEVQGDLMVTLHYAGPHLSSFKAGSNWRLSGHHLEIVRSGQPIIINDVHGDGAMAQLFQATSKTDWLGEVPEHIVSWIGVPMKAKDRVIGILTLDSAKPHQFTQRHADLLMAVAQQAALAMENARLYTHAARSAAQAERSRLARDLHDSVSQAIYGIALASRTLEKLIDPNDTRAGVPLQHILSLSEAAMTEIRALIFELRPESLEREGVLVALSKQADAVRARYGLAVHVNLCKEEPAIPLVAKEAVYRIAQEAMHNTVKHAHARQLWLSLTNKPEAIMLEVRDDGVGFDVNLAWPGQMGLGTMRERAQALGGALDVESRPQQGALIRAVIPLRGAAANNL